MKRKRMFVWDGTEWLPVRRGKEPFFLLQNQLLAAGGERSYPPRGPLYWWLRLTGATKRRMNRALAQESR